MRNMMLGLISCLIGVVTLGIIMTMLGREVREAEMKNNLAPAVEKTLKNTIVGTNIDGRDEMEAAFVQDYIASQKTDTDLKIHIICADYKKGLLAVETEGEYTHPNGRAGKVNNQAVAIVNKLPKDEVTYSNVEFYLSKEDMLQGINSYKKYQIQSGKTIIMPKEPVEKGKVFSCWKDEGDYIADFTQPVLNTRKCYAVWK